MSLYFMSKQPSPKLPKSLSSHSIHTSIELARKWISKLLYYVLYMSTVSVTKLKMLTKGRN